MEIKTMLNEWKQNADTAKLVAVFDKQDGDALDITSVKGFKLESQDFRSAKLCFSKNDENYILEFSNISNFSVEQGKDISENETNFCIRNGIKTLNFVIVNNNEVISFNFVSGTLTHEKESAKLDFVVE